MKSLLMAYFKWYRFSPTNIRSLIVDRNYMVLVIGLRKYDAQTRKRILSYLIGLRINHHHLNKILISTLRKDYISHAALALQILEANFVQTSKLSTAFSSAKERYLDRKRRKENKKQFYENYSPSISGQLIDKSKMEQLERVRQQLKKSIRFH